MSDFVTGLLVGQSEGLAVGRDEAFAIGQEWQRHAANLSAQSMQIKQELMAERASRAINRAEIAGLMAAVAALPPEVQQMVGQAIEQRFVTAFQQRAAELGLSPQYAAKSADVHLQDHLSRLRRP